VEGKPYGQWQLPLQRPSSPSKALAARTSTRSRRTAICGKRWQGPSSTAVIMTKHQGAGLTAQGQSVLGTAKKAGLEGDALQRSSTDTNTRLRRCAAARSTLYQTRPSEINLLPLETSGVNLQQGRASSRSTIDIQVRQEGQPLPAAPLDAGRALRWAFNRQRGHHPDGSTAIIRGKTQPRIDSLVITTRPNGVQGRTHTSEGTSTRRKAARRC